MVDQTNINTQSANWPTEQLVLDKTTRQRAVHEGADELTHFGKAVWHRQGGCCRCRRHSWKSSKLVRHWTGKRYIGLSPATVYSPVWQPKLGAILGAWTADYTARGQCGQVMVMPRRVPVPNCAQMNWASSGQPPGWNVATARSKIYLPKYIMRRTKTG